MNGYTDTMVEFIKHNPNNEIIDISSCHTKVCVSSHSVDLIDQYIANCQAEYNSELLPQRYNALLNSIVAMTHDRCSTKRLCAVSSILFKARNSGIFILLHIEPRFSYTVARFAAMNRQLLIRYADFAHRLGITDSAQLRPIILYLGNRILWGNIYLPEATAIYRGKRFFDAFTTVDYDEIDEVFAHINESKELNEKFDDLRDRILGNDYGMK